MKIGHYMKGLATHGGIRSYIRRVARAQADLGHDVVLFDRRGHGASAIEAHVTESDADLAAQVRATGLDVLHMHTPGDVLSDGSFAIVHTEHGHHAYCPSGSKYLLRANAPCHGTMNLVGCTVGHVVDRCGSLRPTAQMAGYRRVEVSRRSAARDWFIAISDFGRRQMIDVGYDAARIKVLYNPAPPPCEGLVTPPRDASDRKKFIYIGRIVAEKGLATLIEAARHMEADVEIEVIGDGPLRETLVSMSHALGVADKIGWLGWIEDERQLAECIRRAKAIVFPSVWHEPAGLVLSEAAAGGRPIVASAVGGIPEYAAFLGNALLVPAGDPRALALAIDQLAADPEMCRLLGETGWERVHSGVLSMCRHVQELDALYESAKA